MKMKMKRLLLLLLLVACDPPTSPLSGEVKIVGGYYTTLAEQTYFMALEDGVWYECPVTPEEDRLYGIGDAFRCEWTVQPSGAPTMEEFYEHLLQEYPNDPDRVFELLMEACLTWLACFTPSL